MIVHDCHQIVYWIDFNAYRPIELRFGTMQDTDRVHIAAGIAAKYEDRVCGKRGRHEFAMDGVHRYVINCVQ